MHRVYTFMYMDIGIYIYVLTIYTHKYIIYIKHYINILPLYFSVGLNLVKHASQQLRYVVL